MKHRPHPPPMRALTIRYKGSSGFGKLPGVATLTPADKAALAMLRRGW